MHSHPPVCADARPVRRKGARGRSWSCASLAALVAQDFAVPSSELLAATRRSAAAAVARQVAMYLAHVGLAASFSEIGRAFGRDRTTAAHACRVVEERRDDPAFDRLLERLERRCRTALAPSHARETRR